MTIIVRKLRLQRGWTQDQLAEFAGISVRSVQRIERGAEPSLETQKALAAVFEVDLTTLQSGAPPMQTQATITPDEKEAMEFVKGIREFYQHLFMFATFAIVFSVAFGSTFGFDHPKVQMLMLAFAGWSAGVIVHGLVAYEVVRFLGPKWERTLIERRLGRNL
jgi:XRE family transcriptional regulator, regulator of sulfur utilization